jgi:hypothetical protein
MLYYDQLVVTPLEGGIAANKLVAELGDSASSGT